MRTLLALAAQPARRRLPLRWALYSMLTVSGIATGVLPGFRLVTDTPRP